MSRNRDRVGGTQQKNTGTTPPPRKTKKDSDGDAFSFVVPTQFVELPSKGAYYVEGHPLHNEETVEIKHMTAKEEDILTSRSLLKKGLALDRVIQNLIVDKTINADELLVGDRNAIVIAARISSYGADYTTKVTCPACNNAQEYDFNLVDARVTEVEEKSLDTFDVLDNKDGTFDIELPVTKVRVKFKILTGRDEKIMLNHANNSRKNRNRTGKNAKGVEKNVTAQLQSMIVSVNGDESLKAKTHLIDNIPSMDSRHLRFAQRAATPNVQLSEEFECEQCGFETEMEVPLTADFFWPDR